MWCHKSRPERVKSVGGDRVKGAFAFVKMLISSTAQNTQNVRNYVGFNYTTVICSTFFFFINFFDRLID